MSQIVNILLHNFRYVHFTSLKSLPLSLYRNTINNTINTNTSTNISTNTNVVEVSRNIMLRGMNNDNDIEYDMDVSSNTFTIPLNKIDDM